MQDRPTAPSPLLELLDIGLDEQVDDDVAPVGAPSRARKWTPLTIALIAALGLGVAVAAWAMNSSAGGAAPSEPAPRALSVEGFAELYVARYLTAEGDTGDAALRHFYPTAPDGAAPLTNDRYVVRTATLETKAIGGHGWELLVAAEVLTFDGTGYVSDGTHHYLVALAATHTGLAATSLPARVSGPQPAPVIATVRGETVEDPAILILVDGFIAAYATGQGDLRSFVADPESLAPLDPPPYASVERRTLTGYVTEDGTLRLRLLAEATGRDGVPALLEYHLSVVIDGGAVEVDGLAAGPELIERAGGMDGNELGDA